MILKQKYYQFTLIFTLFLIIIGIVFEGFISNLIGLALIFSAGLIHGANDISLLQKKYKNTQSRFFIFLILLYLIVIILGGFFFFIIPSIALIFFLLFSGFHFGQQHWSLYINQKSRDSLIKKISYTIYGLLIFLLLFSFQLDEVSLVIKKITGFSFQDDLYAYTTIFLALSFSLISFLLPITLEVYIKEMFSLLILSILFGTTSLLFSFAVYFVFWHSIPSIIDQLLFLDNEVSIKSLKGYLKSSFVYWIMSLIGLFSFYYYTDLNSDYFIPLFFTFLAAITFPHTLVIGMLKSE